MSYIYDDDDDFEDEGFGYDARPNPEPITMGLIAIAALGAAYAWWKSKKVAPEVEEEWLSEEALPGTALVASSSVASAPMPTTFTPSGMDDIPLPQEAGVAVGFTEEASMPSGTPAPAAPVASVPAPKAPAPKTPAPKPLYIDPRQKSAEYQQKFFAHAEKLLRKMMGIDKSVVLQQRIRVFYPTTGVTHLEAKGGGIHYLYAVNYNVTLAQLLKKWKNEQKEPTSTPATDPKLEAPEFVPSGASALSTPASAAVPPYMK